VDNKKDLISIGLIIHSPNSLPWNGRPHMQDEEATTYCLATHQTPSKQHWAAVCHEVWRSNANARCTM
jgi:hypothetical protein